MATGEGVERWDVIEALASLVGKSMVVGDRAADGGTRYSMLETLRAYARERLDETGDPDHWRRNHAEYYAGFAEQAGSGLEGPDERVWLARVRADLDNVRAAIGWALDSALTADAQLGLRIVAALAYAALIDMTAGVDAWTERAVARVAETTPGRRTAILGTAAIQAIYVGEHERAETLALDALRDGLPPDCPVPAPAYAALASFELNRGRPDEGLRIVRRGLQDLEAIAAHDTYKLSIFHGLVAVFWMSCGDTTTARARGRDLTATGASGRQPVCDGRRTVVDRQGTDPRRSPGGARRLRGLRRVGPKRREECHSRLDSRRCGLAQGTRRRPSWCAPGGGGRHSA